MDKKTYLEELDKGIALLRRARISLEHAVFVLRTEDGCLMSIVKDGAVRSCFLKEDDCKRKLPLAWAIFQYDSYVNSYIRLSPHYCRQAAMAMREIPPVLDDMAQMVGTSARVFPVSEKRQICHTLAKNHACLIKAYKPDRSGVIAVGRDIGQAFAAALVLEKAARVFFQGQYLGGARPIGSCEAAAMRAGYELLYSRTHRPSSCQERESGQLLIPEEERLLREEMAALGRRLVRENLVQGTWGNFSVRLDDTHMLCTPSGLDYEYLTPDDMVRVNLETLEYEGRLKPTSEKAFHANLFKKHGDILCVIHTHPFAGSVFAGAHCPVRPNGEEEKRKLGGEVAVAAYGFPGSGRLAENVVAAIGKNRACIMENHGVLVCGESLTDAYEKCRLLEDCAEKELRRLAREQGCISTGTGGERGRRKFRKTCEKIQELSPNIQVTREKGCIVLRGEVSDWNTAVKAGQLAVDKKRYLGVINDIRLKGFRQEERMPRTEDKSLEGQRPDVLIIGGGITGCAIARELSAWQLDTLLVERGPDVASGASRANGGVVHVGINFSGKSQKHYYNIRGNRMYEKLSGQMDVSFEQKGQIMLCCKNWERFPVWLLKMHGKRIGIPGVRFLEREELLRHEPNLPDFVIGGMYMPIGGITCPFEMTVALAENAAGNGVRFSLNTAVLGMERRKGHIVAVKTNRGTLYPRLVINAAGVYSDKIAEMAGDRTFTIHPRRGTDIVTDRKAGYMVKSSMAKSPFAILPYQEQEKPKGLLQKARFFYDTLTSASHTKGVGLIHSLHGNMLFGPNAVETPDREDTGTVREEADAILAMQQHLAKDLKRSDIITYFTGVRAPTYEEDFVVRRGIFTDNILEAAGIQSPGVTAAPAIAMDIARWAVAYLKKTGSVAKKKTFYPIRRGVPRLASMQEDERAALIRKNPDYGEIVCRCEEVSKGEILDALRSPLPVFTMDGVKQRVRPGMGRCQGGFCSPLVQQIIAEELGVPMSDVEKGWEGSFVTLGETKPEAGAGIEIFAGNEQSGSVEAEPQGDNLSDSSQKSGRKGGKSRGKEKGQKESRRDRKSGKEAAT